MTANPWDKFFWNDWENDPGLKLCGLAAQGLWMRILCICAKADPKGYLVVAGRSLSAADLAALAGKPQPEIEALLRELASYGVYSTDRIGRIYNRKMVRDVKKSRVAVENGAKGGNPSLSKQTTIPPSDNPHVIHEVKPQEPEARSHEPKKKDGALTRFVDFWAVCPKKTGKGEAERAWLKALKLADADTLIAAMRAYADSQSGKDKTFTKTPGPWLDGKHWLDEGIAPCGHAPPPIDEAKAIAAWDGRAAPLVAEIGAAKFQSWFGETEFDPGPPVKIKFAAPFKQNWVSGHFGSELQRIYGDFALEAAA